MTSFVVLGDLILESLTPSVNAPLIYFQSNRGLRVPYGVNLIFVAKQKVWDPYISVMWVSKWPVHLAPCKLYVYIYSPYKQIYELYSLMFHGMPHFIGNFEGN
jgi:hypothetical protein